MRHTIIGKGTDIAESAQLPDEIGIGDVDDGLAKGEVDGSLGGGDGAVDRVHVGAGDGLGGGEGGDELVEHGGGQGAQGVAAVEEDGEAVGLGEDDILGAVVLVEADAVEVDPVS